MKKLLIFCMLSVFSYAWDGYDYQAKSFVEIEKGNLVKRGKDIEIYDYKDGTYKDVEVQSVRKSGNSVEVEVYDYKSKKYRTLEMDDD